MEQTKSTSNEGAAKQAPKLEPQQANPNPKPAKKQDDKDKDDEDDEDDDFTRTEQQKKVLKTKQDSDTIQETPKSARNDELPNEVQKKQTQAERIDSQLTNNVDPRNQEMFDRIYNGVLENKSQILQNLSDPDARYHVERYFSQIASSLVSHVVQIYQTL